MRAQQDDVANDPRGLQTLIRDEPSRFRVDGRVHTEPTIFQLELERIFDRSWLYVAHESEIAEPGDYRTSVMGTQPVIVSRGEDGAIHVVLNRCMHRGAVVCRLDRGHSHHFRCPYHNWVYRNDGTLVGMAQRSGYGEHFDATELDLMRVPRVASYRGLVFACLDPTVEPLEQRLTGTAWYIDQWADRAPEGHVSVSQGVHRYEYPGNWKFQLENGVDGYHGNYVHDSFARILDRSGERRRQDVVRARNATDGRSSARGLPNGDALLEREEGMLGTFDYASEPRYRELLAAAYGEVRVPDILTQRNLLIFPNVYLFESHIRVMRPVSHDATIVETYPTWLHGVSDETNTSRLREHERFFGPSSFGATDDVEMFILNQSGLQAHGARWLDYSRGLEREVINDRGEHVGHSTDEAPQRAIYRRWHRALLEGEAA